MVIIIFGLHEFSDFKIVKHIIILLIGYTRLFYDYSKNSSVPG